MARVRVIKADVSLTPATKQITKEDTFAYTDDIIKPPYPPCELKQIGEYSSIMQQCIDAYKTNIIDFGFDVEYKIDINSEDIDSTVKEAAEKEYTLLGEFVRYLNLDKSPEEILAYVIEDREKTGNGYFEVIRDGENIPREIEYADAEFMRVGKKTDPTEAAYTITRDGVEESIEKQRRFRRYVQQIGEQKVWFKEFGDPRTMNSETGEFSEQTPEDKRATEIYHVKIGSGTYGIPRWIGNIVGVYGARKAEELNLFYFSNGRHIPAAITVSNGTLDDESYNALQSYMNDLQGVENAHKFLLLEAAGTTVETDIHGMEKHVPVKVEIKSLTEMLQKDALFLEYDDRTRQKIRSSFRLTPLYVGEAQEFSRATATEAKRVTEEQVFGPERRVLSRALNAMFLNPLGLKHVKLAIKGPEINDAEEIATVLGPFISAGAVAPNDLRDKLGRILGKKLDLFAEEFNIPLQVMLNQTGSSTTEVEIEKSEGGLVDVLKDLRDVLEDML